MLGNKHFCREEVDDMLSFRKIFAEALVCYHYYNEEDKESPRKLSRLHKNAEHIVFQQLLRGKIFFGTEVVDLTVQTSKVHV